MAFGLTRWESKLKFTVFVAHTVSTRPLIEMLGWQYGTVLSDFAYYVLRTFNRTVSAYRYFSSMFEAYRTYVPYLGTVRFFSLTAPSINLVKEQSLNIIICDPEMKPVKIFSTGPNR